MRQHRDEPGLLGDRDELVRGQQAANGVLPTGERLEAGYRAVGERHLRLVAHRDLPGLDGTPELAGELQPTAAGVLVGGDVADHTARRVLGLVHRDVRVLQHGGRLATVGGEQDDPDRDTDLERGAGDVERSGQGGAGLIGDVAGRLGGRARVQQHGELVPAQARDERRVVELVLQPVGDLL